MLRITVLNDARPATFKMEGKLAHEWVAEAEKAWTAFSNLPQQQPLVVDLCGVLFVDDPGRQLLARMYSSGAKLIGTGPMTSALIEEICGDARPHGSSWIRGVLSLFFLLTLAGLRTGDNILINRGQRSATAFAAQKWIASMHQPVRLISLLSDERHGIDLRKGLSR